jgi:hypoxanthine-guanine phosphoribosyltransferase
VKDLSDDLHDKNVMIVDDVLSSGATFAEMVRIVKKEDIKSVIGLTIFKNTSEAAKKVPEKK